MKNHIWIFPLVILNGILVPVSSSPDKYFNTRCQVNSDCGLDNHLQCIGNYCSCNRNTQIYDRTAHSCQLLNGQKCQLPLYRISPNGKYIHHPSSNPIKCIPSASCTKSVCTCRSGFQSTLDNLCKLDFGSKCYNDDECNLDDGLVCGNTGFCECFNSTWTYQDPFGCVHPKDPTYIEILSMLKETQNIFEDNNLNVDDMMRVLQLTEENTGGNAIAERRQDTYNTNDLIFAAQENSETTESSGGGGRFNFRRFFQRFRNFLPRGNGTLFRNFRNFFRGSPGGYPEASTTTTPAPEYGPPASGYGAPGQPEGERMGGGGFRSFLRNLRMRYQKNVMRFRAYIRNLRNRWFGDGGATTTTEAAPPPPAPAILNPPPEVVKATPTFTDAPPTNSQNQNPPPPPTVIQSNGNFQNNPIFDNNNNDANPNAQNNQGQGTVRFLQSTRDRFRNLLRGNNAQAGYSYAPPSKYGEPAAAEGGDSPPPPAEGGAEPAGSSNFISNTPNRQSFRTQEQHQFTSVSTTGSRGAGSASASTNNFVFQEQQQQLRHQRQPSFRQQQNRVSSHNNEQGLNDQSFFSRERDQLQQNIRQLLSQSQGSRDLRNIEHLIQRGTNNFNAQASSPHHAVAYPQSPPPSRDNNINNQPSPFQRPPSPDQPPSTYFNSNKNVDDYVNEDENSLQLSLQKNQRRVPSFESEVNQIPRFPPSLPVKTASLEREPFPQKYFQEEASDPQSGFTSFTTETPRHYPVQQQSYRDTPRFERIGLEEEEEDEEPEEYTAKSRSNAQSWRETF